MMYPSHKWQRMYELELQRPDTSNGDLQTFTMLVGVRCSEISPFRIHVLNTLTPCKMYALWGREVIWYKKNLALRQAKKHL